MPQSRSEQVRKISPLPGFDSRTAQPVASRYTYYATQPTSYRILREYCRFHEPSTSTLFGPVTSVSENVSPNQRLGKRCKTFEKKRPARIHNLKKNSMIDWENRVAKIIVIVYLACRYDYGEQRKIFSSKESSSRLLCSVQKHKLFEGRIASVTRANAILNSQKTKFVSIRMADPFILLMKITSTYAQNPSTRCRLMVT